MNKNYILIVLITVIGSCRNQGTNNVDKSDRDSLSQISYAKQQDSINRERIFEALGDTVFSGVCYGMNKSQFQKAFDAFKKPLKTEKEYFDFAFGGYEFNGDEGSDVEKNDAKNVNGYPYGLEQVLKEDRLWTYFYKNKLFSVKWTAWRTIQDEHIVKYSLGKLISLFEIKYGKPNVDNTERFNDPMIETGVWDQMKVIARWETEKKKITIFYRELVGTERDKWMYENYPSYYQYELEVHFLDKIQKKEVDEYIKPILQKFTDDYREKLRQDSIKNANAL